MKPAKAETAEERCLGWIVQESRQCLLRKLNDSSFCRCHMNFGIKQQEEADNPETFQGWHPVYKQHERAKMEWGLKNNFITIKDSTIQQMGDNTIFAQFYDWYSGQTLNNPWEHMGLAASTIRDALRVHHYLLNLNNATPQPVHISLQGMLKAIRHNGHPLDIIWFWDTFCRILVVRYVTLHFTREEKENMIEEIINTGLMDDAIWTDVLWADEIEASYQAFKKSTLPEGERTTLAKAHQLSHYRGISHYLLLPKILERRDLLRIQMKSRLDTVREDLIARTYRPDWHIAWTFTEEEKAEVMQDFGVSADFLHRSSVAQWRGEPLPTQ